MEEVLVIVGAAALAIGLVLARARFWPYGPCPACRRRRRGRSRGSTDKVWNRCPRCGGRGERVRPISRIYSKWNEEAKRGGR